MLVREARPEDVYHGLPAALASLYPAPPARAMEQALLSPAPRRILLVAQEQGQIVGTASLFVHRKLAPEHALVGVLDDVAVQPAWQGQSVGRSLVRALLQHAHQEGCSWVTLDCEEALVGYYEAWGFYRNGVALRLDLQRE